MTPVSAATSSSSWATPSRNDLRKEASGQEGKARAAASAQDPAVQREIDRLAKIDRQVRAHEAAHLAASGGLAQGGANFTYTEGPDGKRYAVGGEVSISIPDGRTPEDTLQIAQTVIRAALAPADPSAQDRMVAARATAMASEARAELAAAAGTSANSNAETRPAERKLDTRVSAYSQGPTASPLIDIVA